MSDKSLPGYSWRDNNGSSDRESVNELPSVITELGGSICVVELD